MLGQQRRARRCLSILHRIHNRDSPMQELPPSAQLDRVANGDGIQIAVPVSGRADTG